MGANEYIASPIAQAQHYAAHVLEDENAEGNKRSKRLCERYDKRFSSIGITLDEMFKGTQAGSGHGSMGTGHVLRSGNVLKTFHGGKFIT